LRFDGANDFLTFTQAVNGLTGMSLFLVAANNQNQVSGATHAERAALFWNETAGWGTVYLTPFQSAVYMRFGTTQSGNQMFYNRPSSIGSTFTLTEGIKSGTTDSIYVNGTLVVNQSGKLSTIAASRNVGNVGRGFNDNTFFAGDIAEVLVYTRALTAGERATVEQYLGTKYNLPVAGGGGGGEVFAVVEAPALRAEYQDGKVLIYWSALCENCVLQQRSLLHGEESWTKVTVPSTIRNDQHCVIVPAGEGQLFFRLQK
jgi:hypothetical protein